MHLRLLVTLRSMLPRCKGTKKYTQVVPSLAVGLIVFAFPQDKESFFEIHRTQKKRFSFSRNLRIFLSLTWCLATVLYSSLHYYDGCLERRTVDSCGNSTCLKTPQNCSKEGRLKPFFANNIDIPFARARRLKPCPRKATVRSGKQSSAYVTVYINYED